jgi:hypothetical protein
MTPATVAVTETYDSIAAELAAEQAKALRMMSIGFAADEEFLAQYSEAAILVLQARAAELDDPKPKDIEECHCIECLRWANSGHMA